LFETISASSPKNKNSVIIVPNLYELHNSAEHKLRYFEECHSQTVDWPIDFQSIFSLWKSVVCTSTHILQNIIFCVQQKKEIHTGLDQLE